MLATLNTLSSRSLPASDGKKTDFICNALAEHLGYSLKFVVAIAMKNKGLFILAKKNREYDMFLLHSRASK